MWAPVRPCISKIASTKGKAQAVAEDSERGKKILVTVHHDNFSYVTCLIEALPLRRQGTFC
jgi:hypothetical protein